MDTDILYKSATPIQLEGYTNADWAGYKAYWQSTSGFVFSLRSRTISCSSKKQPSVTLSSTEAKYRGAMVAECEAVWLKRALKDLGVPIKDLIHLYYDNMSSIHLDRNPVFHASTKHIQLHYHFIWELVQAGYVDLQHINTNLQTANIFMKDLGADKLRQFSSELGLSTSDLPSLRRSESRKVEPDTSEAEAECWKVESRLYNTKGWAWKGVLKIKSKLIYCVNIPYEYVMGLNTPSLYITNVSKELHPMTHS